MTYYYFIFLDQYAKIWLRYYIYIYEGFLSVVFFSWFFFTFTFTNASSRNALVIVSSLIFWNNLYEIGMISSFYAWKNPQVKPCGTKDFCRSVLNYNSSLFYRYKVNELSIFSCVSFDGWCHARDLQFYLIYQIYCYKLVLDTNLLSFNYHMCDVTFLDNDNKVIYWLI